LCGSKGQTEMNRLVRCIEGHIFEADQGPVCPVCGASTSLATEALAPPPSGRPAVARSDADARPHDMPDRRRLIAGAGAAAALVAMVMAAWWFWPEPKMHVADQSGKEIVDKNQSSNSPELARKDSANKEGVEKGASSGDAASKEIASIDATKKGPAVDRKETSRPPEKTEPRQDRVEAKCRSNDPVDVLIVACGELIKQGTLGSNDLADAYFLRAGALRDAGKIDEALADFDQSLKLRPQSPRALNDRAFLLIGRNELDRALADLDAAIGLDAKLGPTG
jgi:Tetratricopeptide repeat